MVYLKNCFIMGMNEGYLNIFVCLIRLLVILSFAGYLIFIMEDVFKLGVKLIKIVMVIFCD